jgi:hypothetical protein
MIAKLRLSEPDAWDRITIQFIDIWGDALLSGITIITW